MFLTDCSPRSEYSSFSLLPSCSRTLPADRYQPLADFLSERHSYDEPEIVATPIVEGSPAYLSWIEEETRPE